MNKWIKWISGSLMNKWISGDKHLYKTRQIDDRFFSIVNTLSPMDVN